ncbi:MAG: lipopolysaccharide biosynthesis protein [Sphingosinicella sp.]
MTDIEAASGPGAVERREVARGAGLAGLARAGAAIEIITQPLYIALFGLHYYGLYVILWGAVSLASNVLDLSMPSALQRLVPTRSEGEVHGIVKLALLASVVPALLVALAVALNAGAAADLLAAGSSQQPVLVPAVALFAWAIPLWTFIEVATASARARRAFGPEIRLRIFWEQVARALFAVLYFLLDLGPLGLIAAHLSSLALMVLLCLPLLARYYDLGRLLRASMPIALVRELFATGLALLPSSLSRRLLIDGPPVAISLLIAGPAGTVAAGLFEVARKLSTVPQIVRQAFQYVLAPLSPAQAQADRGRIAALYHFSARISTALAVPLAALVLFSGPDILSLYRREAEAALAPLAILCIARAVEAAIGPATTIVETIGHRALPLINSLIACLIWFGAAWWLTPGSGALGMAIAVALAVVASSAAAAIELALRERVRLFDSTLVTGLAIALAGAGGMALISTLAGGPVRAALNVLTWALASWAALRWGLAIEDRQALGGLSRRLRLI